MNWDSIQGNWKEFKGKAKQQWGKLTDDDLDVIDGKRQELEGRLQKHYGYAEGPGEEGSRHLAVALLRRYPLRDLDKRRAVIDGPPLGIRRRDRGRSGPNLEILRARDPELVGDARLCRAPAWPSRRGRRGRFARARRGRTSRCPFAPAAPPPSLATGSRGRALPRSPTRPGRSCSSRGRPAATGRR